MPTGEIRSQVDRIWDAFWTGGISNRLEVIEQIQSESALKQGVRAQSRKLILRR